jgi:probable F420-dependent oxidoreductase
VQHSTQRYGITIPFDGVTLSSHRELFGRLADLGYTDLWSSEVDGADAFTPLAFAAAVEPRLSLGTAIASAYTRGPALLAQTAAAMAEAAPGRFVLGLGASSPVIVERWNAIKFAEPYARTRDVLRFLREALEGGKIERTYESFSIRGFRLSRPVADPPPIYLAALRPGMLRLAGAEADGVILNWLSANDVPAVLDEAGRDIAAVARLFVLPTEDVELARSVGRRMIAAYLNVDVYAAFHRWLGRGPALEPMWEAWSQGDRRRAMELIPDEVVDDLLIHGSYAACRTHIDRYVAAGVTTPTLLVVPMGDPIETSISELAPRPPAQD